MLQDNFMAVVHPVTEAPLVVKLLQFYKSVTRLLPIYSCCSVRLEYSWSMIYQWF